MMRVDLHPVYCVFINLESLYNVDLTVRGYYQVRLIPKLGNNLSSVDISCVEKTSSSSDHILPGSTRNGIGISRTIELTYVEEVLKLGDLFNIKIQAGPFDLKEVLRLELDVELWSMDRHRPPRFDLFELDSSRTLEIELNPCSLTAVARTVSFDYQAPSVLSLTVFSSLLAMMPRRRKPPPDPVISDRLRQYYGSMCTTLLKATSSIELFIARNASLISTNINSTSIDSCLETASLLHRLESSERPWATLEASAIQLSSRLDVLFNQLVGLYGNSHELSEVLRQRFFDWRMKLLGEAFFFNEHAHSIRDSRVSITNELHSIVAKSKYLRSLAKCSVFCPAIDCSMDNCPVVFEDCYGTSPSTSQMNTESTTNDTNIKDSSTRASSGRMRDVDPQFARTSPSKSFRFLKMRRKSAEALSSKRLIVPRKSFDTSVCLTSKTTSPVFDHSRPPEQEAAFTGSNPPDRTSLPDVCANLRVPGCSSESSLTLHDSTDNIDRLVDFVKERESLKAILTNSFSYEGHLYSELAVLPVLPALLPPKSTANRRLSKANQPCHLVVLVHGLEGSSDDLLPYRNALRVTAPDANLCFLMSSANQCETWTDFHSMSANLLGEVQEHVTEMTQAVDRISFIAHSMGGVIVRAALGRPESEWLYARLHTLLTINTPHLGLAYAGRGVHWGVQFVQWWKRSRSIEQLTLRDALTFQDSFLFRLSQNGAFGRFKNVLLIGSPHDLYVPSHSALLEPCRTSNKDHSALGTAYRDMLSSIYDDLCTTGDDRKHTVARYSTFHSCTTNRSTRLTGRAAHVAAVEDDTFIEKFFSVSALRYFV